MKNVIVVNGSSSSGRTSLVNQFCSSVSETYQKTHIDEYIEMLPSGVWERCAGTDEGWIEIGKRYNEYLSSLANRYDRIIADSFYKSKSAIDHLYSVIDRKRLYFVVLYCEIDELERRETKRGNRKRGLARSQYGAVYSIEDYDLWIDSTEKSVAECVSELERGLTEHRTHVARQQ
jgi:chloramphenicol 3-O phosphotransferase